MNMLNKWRNLDNSISIQSYTQRDYLQIKFRVYLRDFYKEFRRLFYPCSINFSNNGKVMIEIIEFSNTIILNKFDHVMQYTGLDDFNKNPIYEGDLIEIRNVSPMSPLEDIFAGKKSIFGVVVFTDGKFLIKNGFEQWSLDLFQEIEEIHVIGNIYDNEKLVSKYHLENYQVILGPVGKGKAITDDLHHN